MGQKCINVEIERRTAFILFTVIIKNTNICAVGMGKSTLTPRLTLTLYWIDVLSQVTTTVPIRKLTRVAKISD